MLKEFPATIWAYPRICITSELTSLPRRGGDPAGGDTRNAAIAPEKSSPCGSPPPEQTISPNSARIRRPRGKPAGLSPYTQAHFSPVI
jgi:hypothetical protein